MNFQYNVGSINGFQTIFLTKLFGFLYFFVSFSSQFADNLLDDLKTTVNRTTEHLNSANTLKSRDVQFLAPSNTTTIVEERSSSPAGVSTWKISIGIDVKICEKPIAT